MIILELACLLIDFSLKYRLTLFLRVFENSAPLVFENLGVLIAFLF